MAIKNPNEINYVGGHKHFADVIKNSGPGELLIWRQPEEDFNTDSTLIVYPSEEAIFFKGGMVEQVFTEGTYKLSTESYPFISRFRNAFTGGVSTFNYVVYFVRKAHSMEILWGTESPIQVRDPVQGIATSVRARGAYKIQIDDGVKFLVKLVGNNVTLMEQTEINKFFRNEFSQIITSNIGRIVMSSNEEILGICAKQDIIAAQLAQVLQNPLNEYGIRLINFTIAGIEIPENDPNRQRLEAAYATKREAALYGNDYNRFVSREIMSDMAKNPGAGGSAAGIGLGLGVAPVIGNMAQQTFSSMQQMPQQPVAPLHQNNTDSQVSDECPVCHKNNPSNSKFCNHCGAKMVLLKRVCANCGTELSSESKFCNNCGTKVE